MSAGGLDGTVLGTLVTPYMTGLGNLMFAWILARDHKPATDVMTMCLTNNVTNMTLVLGLPAIFWRMNVVAAKKSGGKRTAGAKKAGGAQEINRLSLLLSLVAVLFFTGTTWLLGSDGKISFTDGLVLVGIFGFWQCFQVFEVLKDNARLHRAFSWKLPFDLALFGVGAYGVYLSTDWLVSWVSNIHTGFISATYLGLLSGWLNVMPNALLAFYYAWTGRPEVVYTSQTGDNHVCIPLCIGLFALLEPVVVPHFFTLGVILILSATLVHVVCVGALGRLPRLAGVALTTAYCWFVFRVIRDGLMSG